MRDPVLQLRQNVIFVEKLDISNLNASSNSPAHNEWCGALESTGANRDQSTIEENGHGVIPIRQIKLKPS